MDSGGRPDRPACSGRSLEPARSRSCGGLPPGGQRYPGSRVQPARRAQLTAPSRNGRQLTWRLGAQNRSASAHPLRSGCEPFRQSDHPELCAPNGKRHGQASHGPVARSNCLGSWSIRLCLARPRSTPIGSESTQRALLGALLPTSDVRSLGQRACRNREHRLREPEPEAVEDGWVGPEGKTHSRDGVWVVEPDLHILASLVWHMRLRGRTRLARPAYAENGNELAVPPPIMGQCAVQILARTGVGAEGPSGQGRHKYARRTPGCDRSEVA